MTLQFVLLIQHSVLTNKEEVTNITKGQEVTNITKGQFQDMMVQIFFRIVRN